MKIFYRFSIPRIERKGNIILARQFLLRVYGRYTVVITENGITTAVKFVSTVPIKMDIYTAMRLISRFFPVPYIHHYSKICKLEVITK